METELKPFYALIFTLIGLWIGFFAAVIGGGGDRRSKEIVTPTLKIECTDNVCDTTYIYKF